MELDFDQTELEDICEKYDVERLFIFGSVLDEQRFKPDSDIDILIEFPENQTPGLFTLGRLQQELELVMGRAVDLKTPGFFEHKTQEQIKSHAFRAYDQSA